MKNTKSEPAQTAGNAPEPQEWMRECAKELWPYAGTTPLQTGDALRGDIANVIAKHYAASSQEATTPIDVHLHERTKEELLTILGHYRENLQWYVEERNKLVEQVEAFKREQKARIELKEAGNVNLR